MNYGYRERAYGCDGCYGGQGLCLPTSLCGAFERDLVQFGKAYTTNDVSERIDPSGGGDPDPSGGVPWKYAYQDGSAILINDQHQPLEQNYLSWLVAYPCGCPTPFSLCCCCGLEAGILRNVAYSGMVTKQAVGCFPTILKTDEDRRGINAVSVGFDASFGPSDKASFGSGAGKATPGGYLDFVGIQFLLNLATNNPNNIPKSKSSFRLYIFDQSEYCTLYPLAGTSGLMSSTGFNSYTFSPNNDSIKFFLEFVLDKNNTTINITFYSTVSTKKEMTSEWISGVSLSSPESKWNFAAGEWTNTSSFIGNDLHMGTLPLPTGVEQDTPVAIHVPHYVGGSVQRSGSVLKHADNTSITVYVLPVMTGWADSENPDSPDLFRVDIGKGAPTSYVPIYINGIDQPVETYLTSKFPGNFETVTDGDNSSYIPIHPSPTDEYRVIDLGSRDLSIINKKTYDDFGFVLSPSLGGTYPDWFFVADKGSRMYLGITAGPGAASVDCCPPGEIQAVLGQLTVFSRLPYRLKKSEHITEKTDSCGVENDIGFQRQLEGISGLI